MSEGKEQNIVVKALLFDMGGVLSGDMVKPLFIHLAKKHPESEREKLLSAHSRLGDFWKRFKTDIAYKEDAYWSDVIKAEGLTESVEELKVGMREVIVVFPSTFKVISQLKQGYILGICSNHAVEWFADVAEKCGLYDVFEKEQVIVSQAVGAAKPSPEIFQHAYNALKKKDPALKREEVVFVDDKLANVDAAKKFGFQSFRFDSRLESPKDLLEKFGKVGVKEL